MHSCPVIRQNYKQKGHKRSFHTSTSIRNLSNPITYCSYDVKSNILYDVGRKILVHHITTLYIIPTFGLEKSYSPGDYN